MLDPSIDPSLDPSLDFHLDRLKDFVAGDVDEESADQGGPSNLEVGDGGQSRAPVLIWWVVEVDLAEPRLLSSDSRLCRRRRCPRLSLRSPSSLLGPLVSEPRAPVRRRGSGRLGPIWRRFQHARLHARPFQPLPRPIPSSAARRLRLRNVRWRPRAAKAVQAVGGGPRAGREREEGQEGQLEQKGGAEQASAEGVQGEEGCVRSLSHPFLPRWLIYWVADPLLFLVQSYQRVGGRVHPTACRADSRGSADSRVRSPTRSSTADPVQC